MNAWLHTFTSDSLVPFKEKEMKRAGEKEIKKGKVI